MEIFNNTTKVVKDDLVKKMLSNGRISIAAACFSIYTYQELKAQLESCAELRFIFTSPTFVAEKTPKERREFYIPRLKREKSLYGTEFEVRLRNELKQKAVARECVEWMRRKVCFKSNTTHEGMNNFLLLEGADETYTYIPMNTFTTVDLGCERGNNLTNMITRLENPASIEFLQTFDAIWNDGDKLSDVTEEVIEMISAVYQENSPELVYFMALYNIFSEFLEDISEDVLPNEATGFKNSVVWNKLFNFQKDAALTIINKLEQYNGCILADSVGLGKTFTALAVIKYYEGRNKNVLVLCPKKLSENWMTYRGNLINNPLADDRLRYDVLYHTDLSREHGDTVMGLAIDRINWGNYDLVVIDESHNFRNGNGTGNSEKENRYTRLLNRIIKPGVKTKVLMLSATPVNNRFYDLRNQLALAYEGDPTEFNKKLATKSDIDTIFRQAQAVYNAWCKLPSEERTTAALLSRLDFDFFEVLDSVTIARSRKHIQTFYDTADIGTFPTRNAPISLNPKLTNLEGAINYREVFECLENLRLTIYTPTLHIHASKLHKYLDNRETEEFRKGREYGVKRLMSINLLKRMESSVHSFLLTVRRIYDYLLSTSQTIDQFMANGTGELEEVRDLSSAAADFDYDDQNTDFFSVGKKIKIDLRDMDYISWKREIDADIEALQLLIAMVEDITPEYDFKLRELTRIICEKIAAPINPGNKKILIFTAFADTAEYLYENISRMAQAELGLHTALITGSVDGRTTIPKFNADMNHILTCFSPKSKDKATLYPKDQEIDILIATDCISEGQNLQDCDYCINYDIHWNPVRIIQRFGRIDRIGSQNAVIQLVNFWPDLDLDEYINLKSRVEARMRISVMTSTGDDDLIIHEAENIRLGPITFEDKDAEAVADQDATDISSLPYKCWKLWIVADDDTAPMAERDVAAAQLITKAEKGDLHAQYLTGKLYQDGPVLVPDSVEALYWFEQAAKQGHSAAQYAAGKILLSPDPEIHNPELGIQWLESAAQNKNGYAAYRLGKEYLKGKIVPKDTTRAMDYLTQSAEAGNQYAQYALGKLYLDENDQEQAHYWFTQSATQGNRYAQFFLDRWDSLQPPSVMLATTRLLYHMSRVFQDQTPSPPVHGGIQVDRKLMARIREKKIAMGHKPDDHSSQTQSMSMG